MTAGAGAAASDTNNGARTRVSGLIALALAALGVAVLFRLVPHLDLWFSDLFYVPPAGFTMRASSFAMLFYDGINLLEVVVALALAAVALFWAVRGRMPAGIPWRGCLLFAGTLAIGAGLVVNVVFKDHWGRARPAQVARYGGAAQFTPAFVRSAECRRNCSFTAGHPAFLFAGFGIALAFARRPARTFAVSLTIAAGGLAGLARIMQGAHFLSDVIFSGVFCYLIAWGLAALLYRPRPPGRAPPQHEWFGRDWIGRLPALGAGAARAAAQAWRVVHASARRHPLRALSLGALAVIAVGVSSVDQPLALWLKRHDASTVTDAFRWLTTFGASTGYLIAFAALATLLWLAAAIVRGAFRLRLMRHALQSGFLFLCIAGPVLVSTAAMPLFGRAWPRLYFADGSYGFLPPGLDADRWSFPSGHAVVAGALAAGLGFLWPRAWPVWLTLGVLVAASSFVTIVHYLSDVVAGAWLGAAGALVVAAAFRRHHVDIFPNRTYLAYETGVRK